MTKDIDQIVRGMQTGSFYGPELEEKEFLLLQELCGANDIILIKEMVSAIKASGTILGIPVLLGLLQDADLHAIKGIVEAIHTIKRRSKDRGSFLPDEYFTKEHWQPQWLGSKNAFLSYTQFIADSYIKCGFDESEADRIGQILSEEYHIDLTPFQTFAEYKICQTGWSHDKEIEILADKIAEEQLMDELEQDGIYQSDLSFIKGNLMDLQSDYLIARLKLKGDLKYYRYVLEIAECLNKADT